MKSVKGRQPKYQFLQKMEAIQTRRKEKMRKIISIWKAERKETKKFLQIEKDFMKICGKIEWNAPMRALVKEMMTVNTKKKLYEKKLLEIQTKILFQIINRTLIIDKCNRLNNINNDKSQTIEKK